jgi:hypothetical protein
MRKNMDVYRFTKDERSISDTPLIRFCSTASPGPPMLFLRLLLLLLRQLPAAEQVP